ncbi:hypothetical protein [Lacticaseibacillus zeae]|uniref:Uncharacterized protein n=1 Tax=Lacticaseibacillus zeae subsp. silagei TaxID=3068307 RepID=A0ABD7ZCI6_LACZE|nr:MULTISPECIES: hypothetical protein [Lacticaseibacillus]MDE3314991.1 hypothetical protein [Lacticaseibacillus zeae]OFR95655.1 hypothetical protein HMPREF2861_09045 [Lactobacillus sp. HMSC068F07]WLV84772.1 hypothetical protein LACZS2_001262 [Lacticaseibacillus sp. NCIMB 15475]WLV85437.1 hypothetical protein LACZS1_001816 [Lacticaseibacillus sp. NCIMB 15474]
MNVIIIILGMGISAYFLSQISLRRSREIIERDKKTDWNAVFQNEKIQGLFINETENYALLQLDVNLENEKLQAARHAFKQGSIITAFSSGNHYEVTQFGLPSYVDLSVDEKHFVSVNQPSTKFVFLKIRPYIEKRPISVRIINDGQEFVISPAEDYSVYLRTVVEQINCSNQIAQATKDELLEILNLFGQGTTLSNERIQPIFRLLEANQGAISFLSLIVTTLQMLGL